jgi:hypothetical protein
MKKVVHLFASQRVNRKARTDNEEVQGESYAHYQQGDEYRSACRLFSVG